MNKQVIIEICTDGIDSAMAAQKGGAHRVELCSALSLGGLTPSKGLMEQAIKQLKIPVHVLIRPRGGDFLYSRAEYNALKSDIFSAKVAGASGIVIGMLNSDATIDSCRMKEVIEMCGPLPVTFNRAFDMVADIYDSLEELIDLGCKRVLTSGGAPTAMDGIETIARLVAKADGRIIIMPGGGINESNFMQLALTTKCSEFHLSASTILPSKMKVTNEAMFQAFPPSYYITDVKKVESICSLAAALSNPRIQQEG